MKAYAGTRSVASATNATPAGRNGNGGGILQAPNRTMIGYVSPQARAGASRRLRNLQNRGR